MKPTVCCALLAIALTSTFAAARPTPGPLELSVLVDGRPLPVLAHGGRLYVEARPGAEYAIELRNRGGDTLAVALTVDGLNSIDGRHTSAAEARKWVVRPWGRVVVSGWQVSAERARRFYFTTEPESYAAARQHTLDLGLIAAAVYRERRQPVAEIDALEAAPRGVRSRQAPAPSAAPAPEAKSAGRADLDGSLAATGMGRDQRHRVRQVSLDLEAHPCQVTTLRYEYRDALVRLGVLPAGRAPLDRRERASGFADPPFCPEFPRPRG